MRLSINNVGFGVSEAYPLFIEPLRKRMYSPLNCAQTRQKRPSRRPVWSESGVRHQKGMSQLLRVIELAGLRPEKVEKAVSEARME
ncbi:hypothetical protein ASG93_16865 [Paenibacillus sp. Soil787]|nr:hypothetical protein ASG93_16865 [Paenibacillus sp. Soil787]